MPSTDPTPERSLRFSCMTSIRALRTHYATLAKRRSRTALGVSAIAGRVRWRGICLQEQERKVRHPKGRVGRVYESDFSEATTPSIRPNLVFGSDTHLSDVPGRSGEWIDRLPSHSRGSSPFTGSRALQQQPTIRMDQV